MFDKLNKHFKKTIYLSIILLAVFFFLTTIIYSASVLYADCREKTLSISTQYARCLEVQLDSISQPFALINNQLLSKALDSDDTNYLHEVIRTVQMSHYSFLSASINKCDTPNNKSEYYNLSNKTLSFKVPYNYAADKYILGDFKINLLALNQALDINNNIFMKNASVYLSLDGNNFQCINIYANNTTYKKLISEHNYFYTLTPIMNDRIYVFFQIPKSNVYVVIAVLILICIIILLSLTALSLALSRSYINHTIDGLEQLINNMDSYINKKGGEK